MDISNLLSNFILIFGNAQHNLIPFALALLYYLTAFQIIYALSTKVNEIPFVTVFHIILMASVWRIFILYYGKITNMIYRTCMEIGLKGAGINSNRMEFNPNLLFSKGYAIINRFGSEFKVLQGSTYGYAVAWILGVIIVLFLALNVFIFLLEYFALMSLGVILVPFLICEKTSFIGTKIFQIIVSQAIRLTTYTFLVSITYKVLDTRLEEIKDTQLAFGTVLSLAGLTFLSWRTPDLVGGILNGTPSLNFSHAWQNAGNLKNGTIAGARGAYSVGRSGYNIAKNSPDMAKNIKDKFINSYSKIANFNRKKD
ncbi:MAG: type IV secretion system protein [Cetobacterium sp.]|nr:type IV secretion system protein [Cetobacterium sp.]